MGPATQHRLAERRAASGARLKPTLKRIMTHPREIYTESPEELEKSLENPAMDVNERKLRTNALIIAKLRAIEKKHHWSLAARRSPRRSTPYTCP